MSLAQTAELADTWGMHGDVGAGWMILMMILMVFFWAAIVFGVVWLVRDSADGRAARSRESPTEILDRRFAEGAISVEDYRTRRAVLVKGAGASNGAGTEPSLRASRAREGS